MRLIGYIVAATVCRGDELARAHGGRFVPQEHPASLFRVGQHAHPAVLLEEYLRRYHDIVATRRPKVDRSSLRIWLLLLLGLHYKRICGCLWLGQIVCRGC